MYSVNSIINVFLTIGKWFSACCRIQGSHNHMQYFLTNGA